MTDLDSILTGRSLVGALGELGIGTWTPASVRQWIREEPPLPIAEHADQGKPHRYLLRDALVWLKARAQAERAKGFTRGDGADLVARLDRALSGEPVCVTDTSRCEGQAENSAANTAAPLGAGAGGAGTSPVSPAKVQTDWLQLSDTEALLQVLQGRDPRNWKAAEEAMTTRRERLEAERRLIPIDELDAALDLQTEHVRRGIDAARQQLKRALADFVHADMRLAVERQVDDHFAALLQRLASVDDLNTPEPADEAAA